MTTSFQRFRFVIAFAKLVPLGLVSFSVLSQRVVVDLPLSKDHRSSRAGPCWLFRHDASHALLDKGIVVSRWW